MLPAYLISETGTPVPDITTDKYRLMRGDCLELMQSIPDGSVDMILCDLPYGTTACKWDAVIPFEPLWEQYRRVIRSRCAVVLFGDEPFSSHLRLNNLAWWKYDWVWLKSRALGFTNAKNKPMKRHEIISVFSDGTTANKSDRHMAYHPQGLIQHGKKVSGIKACAADAKDGGHKFGRPGHKEEYIQEFTNYPVQTIEFANEAKPVHPTQKPVALMEYLIRTYTNEGETVLDNCMGSGTTGVACANTGRRFIGIERDKEFYRIACDRIFSANTSHEAR